MNLCIDVVERLGTEIRAGRSVRAALVDLPRRIDSALVVEVARLARLGAPISRCVAPLRDVCEEDADLLATTLTARSSAGLASALDDLADSWRRRTEAARDAATASAGAGLSAKLIAILPLLLLPTAFDQLDDPIVACSALLGLVVGAVGYRWLTRIIPATPPVDPIAEFAAATARASRGGLTLDEALRASVGVVQGSRRADAEAARRRVDLGSSWAAALDKVDGFEELAEVLRDARSAGTPAASAFERVARDRRRVAAQSFERDLKRAPVKMIVPLACCILPGFLLVALVPMLRELAQTQ